MKRRQMIWSALLAGSMVMSLAACQDSGDASATAGGTGAASAQGTAASNGEDGQKEASGEATVVDVWTNDRHDQDYVEEMVNQFNESHDDIQINMTVITDEYTNMIQMAVTGGTAPDIVGTASTDGINLNTWVEGNMFAPLTEYVKDEEFEKVTEASKLWYEGMNAIGDDIYWVPTAIRSGSRIEYNEKLLQDAGYSEIPSTLSELVDMCKTITETGNGSYYGVGFTSSGPFGRWLEGVCELSGIYRYDYTTGTFNFDGYKEVIEEASRLFTDNSVFPGSTSQGVDAMRAQFATGTFAVWGNASQEAGVFTDQFPITDFEWGVAMPPTLDGEVKGTLTASPTKGYAILESSDAKDAAWEVIKYFSSEEFMTGYLENGYALPISDYMSEAIDSSKTGRLADFAITDYEGVYPTVPNVTVEGDDYAVTLWNAVMGNVSADEAIADLNERYNNALDNDVAAGKVQRVVVKDFDPMHPSEGTVEYLSE